MAGAAAGHVGRPHHPAAAVAARASRDGRQRGAVAGRAPTFRTLSICEAPRIARAAKLGSVRATSAKYWRRASEVVGIIVGSGRRTVIAAPCGARLPEFASAQPSENGWVRSLNPKLICEVHETGVLCHRKYFTVRV